MSISGVSQAQSLLTTVLQRPQQADAAASSSGADHDGDADDFGRVDTDGDRGQKVNIRA